MKYVVFAVSAFDVKIWIVNGGAKSCPTTITSKVSPVHIIPPCRPLPLLHLEVRLSRLQLPQALPVYPPPS